jgi:CheY-like chemotaxis protein
MTGEPLTILLVEDNHDHAELIIRNLEEARVSNRLIHVDDGEKAMEYLRGSNGYTDRSIHPLPHLVLLDLRLPKKDGLEVLREIKTDEKLRAVPVVILTTSAAERDMAQAYEYHANSYVTKPVDFATFGELLRELGFYWLAWNKCPW